MTKLLLVGGVVVSAWVVALLWRGRREPIYGEEQYEMPAEFRQDQLRRAIGRVSER